MAWDHTEGLEIGAECLEAAQTYLKLGWSPLCLCPPDHVGVGRDHRGCEHPGKRPLPDFGRWKEWQTARPTPEVLSRWWHSHPNANVGCALGPVSGLVRLDIEGEAAEARLAEVSGGDLPETLEFTSGKGRGLLYAIPPGLEARTGVEGLADGELRIQGLGAQTVLPPSRHANGSRYVWLAGRSPREIYAAAAPQWLLDRLAKGQSAAPTLALADGDVIPAGQCDTTLTRMAGAMRRQGFTAPAIYSALLAEIESGRCETQPGKRPYDESDADRIARSVGRYEPDAFAGVRIVGVLNGHPAGQIVLPAALLPSEDGQAQSQAPSVYTHDELLDATFPPQRWLLDGLIPCGGLVILGGKKKLGKSWLCLQIAQAVAGGSETLGKKAASGKVVYICLEDGGRRLQDRLLKQGSRRGLPIQWYTSFPKLDDGGLDELCRVMAAKPALLIIDTLAAAKTGKVDENSSGPMGDLGNALRVLAQQFGVAVAITHHHGKHSYGDPGDDLRGSSALAAAADLNVGIYRMEDGFRLRGEGRDIEPFDYAVTFDANASWAWKLIGDARAMASTEADQAVLFALANLGESTAGAVAVAIGKSEQKTRDRLNDLVTQKRVLIRMASSEGQRGKPAVLYRLPPADASFGDDVTPF